jgi:glutathione peroxidase
MKFHDFAVRTLTGQDTTLSDWQGKLVLVVNVASQCGLTPQYSGLQALHERYRDRGFAVLGFPCNQFGAQEPGSEAQIAQFCETRYQVSFPMFSKINVNGPEAHALFAWLRAQTGGADIGWNFAKFLVDARGTVAKRYAPTDTPESIEADVRRLLV